MAKIKVACFFLGHGVVATSTLSSATVADVDLPLANEMKMLGLGVILDRHLTFKKHVSVYSCTIVITTKPSATFAIC